MLNTPERADLHVHYHPTRTPELLAEARKHNVTALALLEHGSVTLEELDQSIKLWSAEYDIPHLLPGVELLFKSIEGIHYELIVLGWRRITPELFDLIDPRGNSNLSVTREKVSYQTEFLANRLGFYTEPVPNNREMFEAIHTGLYTDTAIRLCRAALANPANAVKVEQYRRAREDAIANHEKRRPEKAGDLGDFMYFRHFTPQSEEQNPEESAYRVWGVAHDPREVTKIAHGAEAVAYLAHPYFQHFDQEPMPRLIMDRLVAEANLDGWENWYGDIEYRGLLQKARKERKIALGGSGKSLNYANRSVGLGDMTFRDMLIPAHIIDELEEYKARAA